MSEDRKVWYLTPHDTPGYLSFENQRNGDGGTILIENNTVIDYDGVYALPEGVVDELVKLGIRVPNCCRQVEDPEEEMF